MKPVDVLLWITMVFLLIIVIVLLVNLLHHTDFHKSVTHRTVVPEEFPLTFAATASTSISYLQEKTVAGLVTDIPDNNVEIFLIPSFPDITSTNIFNNLAAVADNAQALIFLTLSGKLDMSSKLINTFLTLAVLEGYYPNSDRHSRRIENFNGLFVYYDVISGRHSFGANDLLFTGGEVVLGPNAWVVIALCKYVLQFFDDTPKEFIKYYINLALDIVLYLHDSRASAGTPGGYICELQNRREYVSSTQNTLFFSATGILFKCITQYYPDNDEFRQYLDTLRVIQKDCADLVSYTYFDPLVGNACIPQIADSSDASFYMFGLTPGGTNFNCSIAHPADAITLNQLSNIDPSGLRKKSSMQFLTDNLLSMGTNESPDSCGVTSKNACSSKFFAQESIFHGLRYSDDAAGIQWSQTAYGFMALLNLIIAEDMPTTAEQRQPLQMLYNSMVKITTGSGGVPSSFFENGVTPYGSMNGILAIATTLQTDEVLKTSEEVQVPAVVGNTGMGFSYFKETHIGATACVAMAMAYAQSYDEASNSIDEGWNPMSDSRSKNVNSGKFQKLEFIKNYTGSIYCALPDNMTTPEGNYCDTSTIDDAKTISTYCDASRSEPTYNWLKPDASLSALNVTNTKQYDNVCGQSPFFTICDAEQKKNGLKQLFKEFNSSRACINIAAV